jgi:cytochrome c553
MRICKTAPLAAMAALAAALSALAQQPAPPAPAFAASNTSPAGVRAMAANCAGCHGTEGRPVEGSSVADLAGLPDDFIVVAMKEFKDGTRPATVMHQLAKGYTDAEIAAVAAYFSNLKR